MIMELRVTREWATGQRRKYLLIKTESLFVLVFKLDFLGS